MLLDDVVVRGARLDGIHVRRSTVTIRDCVIRDLAGPYAQGIDVSFGFDLAPSVIEGCEVSGGMEGIVTHFTHAVVRDNRVSGTSLRGITLTEMSMAEVEQNEVGDALGVGIFCGDYSMCRIEENSVTATATRISNRATAPGWATASWLITEPMRVSTDNRLRGNVHPIGSFLHATISSE